MTSLPPPLVYCNGGWGGLHNGYRQSCRILQGGLRTRSLGLSLHTPPKLSGELHTLLAGWPGRCQCPQGGRRQRRVEPQERSAGAAQPTAAAPSFTVVRSPPPPRRFSLILSYALYARVLLSSALLLPTLMQKYPNRPVQLK